MELDCRFSANVSRDYAHSAELFQACGIGSETEGLKNGEAELVGSVL